LKRFFIFHFEKAAFVKIDRNPPNYLNDFAGFELFFCPFEAVGCECERAASIGGDSKRSLEVVIGWTESTNAYTVYFQLIRFKGLADQKAKIAIFLHSLSLKNISGLESRKLEFKVLPFKNLRSRRTAKITVRCTC
jgi:hypothetical protein